MAQAKRKSQPKKKPAKQVNAGHTLQGLAMLCAGIVIGSLATILWQGTQSNNDGVGTGIREMIEQSRQSDQVANQVGPTDPVPQPEPQKTNFDFFTVLPEIEVVVPDNVPPEPPKPKVEAKNDTNQNPTSTTSQQDNPGSAFMLQAGSYQRETDAERLKASLALKGMVSTIQKVSIQGRGDFYRVRLGPFLDHAEMVAIDDRLNADGIRSLRLKVSRQ